MAKKHKQEIIDQILDLLMELTEEPGSDEESTMHPMEMLTIKECTELVKGLSSNTIRKLIARGELDYVRAGCGNNGKILISKANLIALFSKKGDKA